MANKLLNYLKNNVVTALLNVFLFFVPSFDDFKKLAMSESITNVLGLFTGLIPNFITGGILVFLFMLYRNTLKSNSELKEDLDMIRFISEYRKDYMTSISLGDDWNNGTGVLFADNSFIDGDIGRKYTEHEKRAAVDFFVVKMKLLHEQANQIVNRYYEHN